jgi:dCMP deaminase
MIMRPSRDEWLIRMAVITSARGTCLRASVGAIISRDGRIISTGYVGSPRGLPHCTDVGCDESTYSGCIRTVHAEANAIAFAARHGISTEGSELHCTHSPCGNCAKLIINAGIIRVVYDTEYRDITPLDILDSARIEHLKWTPESWSANVKP